MNDITNLNDAWENIPVTKEDKLLEVKNSVKRLTYPQDWASYNKSQTRERLLSERMLLEILENLPRKNLNMRGRRGAPLAERIYSMFVYTFTGQSSRRTISELQIARERGIITTTPHFNTILNYFSNVLATPLLEKILLITSLPLRFIEEQTSVDSTGFSTSVFKRWLDIRTQKTELKRTWKKAHALTGAKTHIIIGGTLILAANVLVIKK